MISLISPAKTLDLTPEFKDIETLPRFQKETNSLARALKKYSPSQLSQLMKISEKLALLNKDRYSTFSKEYTKINSKPAILSFKGDVYVGLQANDFNSKEIEFTQVHTRILSGLYGLLRPYDLMQAYRLEMSTKLNIRKYKNLYEFWGNKITKLLQEDIDKTNSNVLINLASIEYFKAINTKKIKAKIINVNFKEYRNDELKFISFSAKKARGLMTRYIIKNQITDYNDLLGFNYEDYYFESSLSNETDWLFVK